MGNLRAPERVNGSINNKGLADRSPKAIRILIADELPIFRQGLQTVLETQPDLQVVGNTSDGAEAIELARECTPDVLLLDLAIHRLSGPQILRKVRRSAPQVRTVLLAAEIDTPGTLETLKLGARGVMPKDCSAELLFKGIRSVMAGQYWVGRERIADILELLGGGASASPNGPLENNFLLTPREVHVISAIVEGESNKGIAKKFGLSQNTVKHHLTHIFDKLGAGNRLELAIFAIRRGLLGKRPPERTQGASASSPSHSRARKAG